MRGALIQSGYLVQVLRRGGAVYHCVNCGGRMFVRYASGLCPLCFNGRRAPRVEERVHDVAEAVVLAAVLDDPAIEVPPESTTESDSP